MFPEIEEFGENGNEFRKVGSEFGKLGSQLRKVGNEVRKLRNYGIRERSFYETAKNQRPLYQKTTLKM